MRGLAPLLLALALGACATYKPQDIRAGQTAADVSMLMGAPTNRYPLPDGSSRLEYATGPQGRVTWMVDLDANGQVVAWQQVLNERSFLALQTSFEGMNADDLKRTLGRPGHVRSGGWQGGWVWSWRYPTNECFWYQVSIMDDGRLRDGGAYGIDPQCDPGSGPGRR